MASFDIAEIVVTHSYHYQSTEYLKHCEENDEEPTQEGFFKYIEPEINGDFPESSWHPYMVIRHADPQCTVTDDQALDAVVAFLAAEDWSSDQIEALAETVRGTGRRIEADAQGEASQA